MKFDFSWFKSKERKDLLALQIIKEKLEINLLEEKLHKPDNTRPYKKLIYSNGNITVVFSGGVVINQKDVSSNVFESIKNATSERDIKDLLVPSEIVESFYSELDLTQIRDSSSILLGDRDFEFKKGDWFLKGVNLPIEPLLLAAFIEIKEKMLATSSKFNFIDTDEYVIVKLEEKQEALKMFWRWAALNPIDSSRRDLFRFIRENDISITHEGMLELYRRVVSKGTENKELVKFVSEQYFKVKKWKKSPKHFEVFKVSNDEVIYEYILGTSIGDSKVQNWNSQELVGNLEELYLNLPSLSENVYTDAHTETKVIKIGEIYREDEDKINLDNSVNCSRGLHVGSKSFGFDGFGDTGVVALVNPMKVRSVPLSSSNKMRVSEMFIVGIVNLQEYSDYVDSEDISSYSEEYSLLSVSELEMQLQAKSWDKLSCQDNVPAVSIVDIKEITKALKERIINF